MSLLYLTADGKKVVRVTVSGPTSYPTGGFDVRTDLNRAEAVLKARANTGLLVEGRELATGNVARLRVYYQTGASGTPMDEVASGLNLSGVTFTADILGY